MVYDFQKYKFLFRLPKQTEGIPEKMLRVATALWEHKVKLNATWSRMRVTASAQSPVQLLPVKKLEQFYSICTAPLYCRVMSSQKGITWTSLSVELGKLGISLVSTPGQITSGRLLGTIISEGLLTLSPECRQIIYSSSITQGRMFLPQVRLVLNLSLLMYIIQVYNDEGMFGESSCVWCIHSFALSYCFCHLCRISVVTCALAN